ncbi:Cupredoxin [Zychaea mexicana]|uniref:Cupredoxin n=1 Tax=Zychaea mexicana TaxID=64656 RepID=UPI0022FDFC18|nr:Cupredoxin [Zychaea mexicana]KAI9482506.1 Cupredoxin [Zychaea mexicana]
MIIRFLAVCLLIAHLAASQSTEDDVPDKPEPYIPRPVTYEGDFRLLHDELNQPLNGLDREYYIAVEEIVWDYTQYSTDIPENTATHFWTADSSIQVGNQYYKALYREYTDSTYSALKPRPQWQGLLGPILRAEVGDTLRVHLWNKASHDFSMHPHGVFYEFEMEGAVYKDAKENSFVKPNDNFTYTWQVEPRSGPGPADGDSLVWGYHSHVTENDIFTGLFGAIVVYRPGALNEATIANEVVTAMFAINENHSPYLSQTVQKLAPYVDLDLVKYNQTTMRTFRQSNIKRTINGLLMSEPNDLILKQDKQVQWHLLGWGSFNDLQMISWQQAQISLFDVPVSQIRLLPATFRTVQVIPDTPGTFEFGYLNGGPGIEGMIMYYQVANPAN